MHGRHESFNHNTNGNHLYDNDCMLALAVSSVALYATWHGVVLLWCSRLKFVHASLSLSCTQAVRTTQLWPLFRATANVSSVVQADALARDAQSQRGFALSQPPWVAHLCMPHWKIVLTLLSSHLALATPSTPLPGPTLEQLTATLSRVLSICTEYFSSAGVFNDGDSDTILSLNLSTSQQNTVTSLSPLGAAPMRPGASDAAAVGSGSVGHSPGSSPTAAALVPRTSLAAVSTAAGGSAVLSQAGAFHSADTSEAPLNVYMPPDNLHASNVRPPSPLKQEASAVAASSVPVGTFTATVTEAPTSRHLHEALCLQVSSTLLAGSGDCDDTCMSAFDLNASPQVQPQGSPLQSELHRIFAHMYEIVDRGLGDDESDAEDTTSTTSPAAVLHMYPKIVSNLPIPKPSHHVQHAQHGQGAGHTSPTSTGITSPTPQSSLRLTYRSGSLSVSLPATEATAVQQMIPKPTVESFGLEPDEATSISLGATPIPCMLAVCFGPDGGSSSATVSPTSSSASHTDAAAASQAAAQDPFVASDPHNAVVPLDTNEQCSSNVNRHAQPVPSHLALPDAAADSGAAPSDSPSGSPLSLGAPQSLSNTHSNPVAIPPHSAEAHQHHAHPFCPSTYPQGTVTSYEDSASSVPVVPFAPCSHIFGAGGTSLCTAELSDPTCAAAARSPPESHEQRVHNSQSHEDPSNITTRDMHASECCESSTAPPEAHGALGPKHNAFGSDEFNADAFNAVPSELRHTFCRLPPVHAMSSVSAPALVSAYSCWHTPCIEHDCESFADSSSPRSATDVDESAFGSVCEPTAKSVGDALGPSPLGPLNGISKKHHFTPHTSNNGNASLGDDDSDDDVIGAPGTSLESEAPVVQVRTLMPPAATNTSSGAASMPSLPACGSMSSLPSGQQSTESNRSQAAPMLPPCAPPQGMPFGGTAGANCFVPPPDPSAHTFARPWSAQGGALHREGMQECVLGGLARSRSPPPRTFQPPRPPSPCVDASGHKQVSQSNPGCSSKSEGDCGAMLSRSGNSAADVIEPAPAAVFARPTAAGSSAPLLRNPEGQGGGGFGGLLWGREGPGSAGGHMRARSVCLDNLDL